jgi:Mn-dependent DtxR family transcriptional regulator
MRAQPGRETQTQEDYLERIHELIEEKGYARVSDIATELKLKHPTVTVMVQQLSKLGYLNYERYRGFTLTLKGLKVARNIKARHNLLTEFFLQLHVEPRTVAQDIEGIEHHLSNASLAGIKRLIAHLRKHPLP